MSVATMAAGFLVLALPYAGIPLAAFALGWVTYRFGTVPAAVLALSASAVVTVFGPSLVGSDVLDGLFVAVVLIAIGPVAAELLKRFAAPNVAIGIGLVITGAFLAAPFGAQMLVMGRDMLGRFLASMAASNAVTDPAALKAASEALIRTVSETWPAGSFYTMGLSTALAVPLIARAARSLGLNVKSYGPLAEIDLSFHIMWPTILGLGLTALGTMWSQAPSWVGLAGRNALMIVQPLLFFQGAAVFASLYRRVKAGRVTKAFGFVLLLLTEFYIPSVSVLGAVDLFANLRKLPRAGTKPAVVAV